MTLRSRSTSCNIDELLKREQYYFNLLSPEYNVLKIAGSRLGYKHSEATKEKMSNIGKGENNFHQF